MILWNETLFEFFSLIVWPLADSFCVLKIERRAGCFNLSFNLIELMIRVISLKIILIVKLLLKGGSTLVWHVILERRTCIGPTRRLLRWHYNIFIVEILISGFSWKGMMKFRLTSHQINSCRWIHRNNFVIKLLKLRFDCLGPWATVYFLQW